MAHALIAFQTALMQTMAETCRLSNGQASRIIFNTSVQFCSCDDRAICRPATRTNVAQRSPGDFPLSDYGEIHLRGECGGTKISMRNQNAKLRIEQYIEGSTSEHQFRQARMTISPGHQQITFAA